MSSSLMLSKSMFTIGSMLLLHASYSCSHWRELVQEVEESSNDVELISNLPALPLDVWIEVGLGFCLILVSELSRGGSALRPIMGGGSNKKGGKGPEPLMAPIYLTRDFDIYSTRAKVL